MKVVNLQVSIVGLRLTADDVLGEGWRIANGDALAHLLPIQRDAVGIVHALVNGFNRILDSQTAGVHIVGDGQPLDVDTMDPQLLLTCAEFLMQKYQERTKP